MSNNLLIHAFFIKTNHIRTKEVKSEEYEKKKLRTFNCLFLINLFPLKTTKIKSYHTYS